MDEAGSQEDAALSLSDGGPLRRVRDPGGLESEGLTLRRGSILKSRSPHMSQISDSQASIESSAVTAQGQAVLSQSESELAIAHAVSTAAADSSLAGLPGDEMQSNVSRCKMGYLDNSAQTCPKARWRTPCSSLRASSGSPPGNRLRP